MTIAVQRRVRPAAKIARPMPFAQCGERGSLSPCTSLTAPPAKVEMPITIHNSASDPRSRTLAVPFFARVATPMMASDATHNQITIRQMMERLMFVSEL
jgi:hypothetical protein